MRRLRLGKRTAGWVVSANNNNVCQFNVAHRIALKTAHYESIYSRGENFGLLTRPSTSTRDSASEYNILQQVAGNNTEWEDRI